VGARRRPERGECGPSRADRGGSEGSKGLQRLGQAEAKAKRLGEALRVTKHHRFALASNEAPRYNLATRIENDERVSFAKLSTTKTK
jgi:hypothetical protein